jgi:hypothetical protein
MSIGAVSAGESIAESTCDLISLSSRCVGDSGDAGGGSAAGAPRPVVAMRVDGLKRWISDRGLAAGVGGAFFAGVRWRVDGGDLGCH